MITGVQVFEISDTGYYFIDGWVEAERSEGGQFESIDEGDIEQIQEQVADALLKEVSEMGDGRLPDFGHRFTLSRLGLGEDEISFHLEVDGDLVWDWLQPLNRGLRGPLKKLSQFAKEGRLTDLWCSDSEVVAEWEAPIGEDLEGVPDWRSFRVRFKDGSGWSFESEGISGVIFPTSQGFQIGGKHWIGYDLLTAIEEHLRQAQE